MNPRTVLDRPLIAHGLPAQRWRDRIAAGSKAIHRRHVSEFGWVLVGRLAGALGGIVGVKLLTSLLSTRDYGQFALALTVSTLGGHTVLAPAIGSGRRLYSAALRRNAVDRYLSVLARQFGGGLLAFAGLAAALLLGTLVAPRIAPLHAVAGGCAAAVLIGFTMLFEAVQTAARHRKIATFHTLGKQWVPFLGAAAMVVAFDPGGTGAIWGYTLGLLLVVLSQCVAFYKVIYSPAKKYAVAGGDGDTDWRHSMTTYGRPFAVWGVFAWVQSGSDRWALQAFEGPTEVGVYQALFQLGYTPMLLAAATAAQLMTPIVFGVADDGQSTCDVLKAQRLSFSVTLAFLALTAGCCLFVGILHEWIFKTFTGFTDTAGSSSLPVVVLGGGLFGAGQLISMIVQSQVRTDALVAPKVGAAMLALVLNVLGASLYGIRGVAAAVAISGMFYVVWIYLLYRHIRPDAAVVEGS